MIASVPIEGACMACPDVPIAMTGVTCTPAANIRHN